jgi:hypothetical protein
MPDPLAGLPPRFLRTPEAARLEGLRCDAGPEPIKRTLGPLGRGRPSGRQRGPSASGRLPSEGRGHKFEPCGAREISMT